MLILDSYMPYGTSCKLTILFKLMFLLFSIICNFEYGPRTGTLKVVRPGVMNRLQRGFYGTEF